MKILELFSGTNSVGKVAKKRGYDVVSVDIDNKFKPTHNISILEFDYKQYKHFDFIWASPPCCNYSRLQNTWLGREKKINGIMTLFTRELLQQGINESNKLLEKTFEIINYFKPIYWCIENPKTGKMKHQDIMKDKPYADCSYCMYGFEYRKHTRIWNNFNLNLKVCNKKCGSYKNGKHISHAVKKGGGNNRYERFKIPSKLIEFIFNWYNFYKSNNLQVENKSNPIL